MHYARFWGAVALAATAVVAMPAAPASAASAEVAALQVAMRSHGLYPHPVDGITGPWTRRAVRAFQSRRSLAVDGVAGRHTRRALGRMGRPRLGRRPMRRGARGWDVAALQFLLRSRSFGQGGLDGVFGPHTELAVRGFQRAAHIGVDGVAGRVTLRALRRREVSAAPGGPVRFLRPVPGTIGDGFGYPGGRRHTGIDFPEPTGTPVGAAGVGVVASSGWNSGGYGYLVVVRHRLGYETWYAHLSRIAASRGQSVVGGSRIGYVGATGRATGPHLHFEVRHFGTPIDPAPFLLPTVAARARGGSGRRLVCRPNADARRTSNTDPPLARIDRCP